PSGGPFVGDVPPGHDQPPLLVQSDTADTATMPDHGHDTTRSFDTVDATVQNVTEDEAARRIPDRAFDQTVPACEEIHLRTPVFGAVEPALPGALSRRRGAQRTGRPRGHGHPRDAIGLARLVPSLRQLCPQHAPRATRREQPIGLTPERAEELFLETLTPEIDGVRQIRMQILDERLCHD